ncbi:MAG: iron-containing alcohol dehydrogenase [Oscillospiraceae bacterium]|nr:iron-containing alcohol dehydrogenase [Oscillospiraceae bacterium]
MKIPESLKNISIKKILIKENITPEYIKFTEENYPGRTGCVICDENTYKAAGKILDLNCGFARVDLNKHHADEYMVEDYDKLIFDKNYDYFTACGAGTIHDITRVLAHKYNKPFISFPTAASVDGFVSSIAPLTSKAGIKLTLPSVSPAALFADTRILANAPPRLTASGLGDLIGKFIALADWRIANLLTGEDIDENIINLVFGAVTDVLNYRRQDDRYSHELFCEKLLEALILSGLCMQSMGNSRPASGAEHHIAHFFEMNILGENSYLHGENVAIGAVLCHEIYRKFFDSQDIKFVENYAVDKGLIKKYYGGLTDEIIKENAPLYLHKITPGIFYENLDGIKKILKETALYQNIPSIVPLLAKEFDCEVSSEAKELALKLAPYVRNRFTLLKLCRCLEF